MSLLPQGGREGVHFTHLVHCHAVVVVGDLQAHSDGLLQGQKEVNSYWVVGLTSLLVLLVVSLQTLTG